MKYMTADAFAIFHLMKLDCRFQIKRETSLVKKESGLAGANGGGQPYHDNEGRSVGLGDTRGGICVRCRPRLPTHILCKANRDQCWCLVVSCLGLVFLRSGLLGRLIVITLPTVKRNPKHRAKCRCDGSVLFRV